MSDIKAKDNNLYVYWYKEGPVKYFTVVCECGNNRLLIVENGIRCTKCGYFHTHDSFLKAKEKVNRCKMGRDATQQIPQPFIEQWKMWKRQRELRKKYGQKNNISVRPLPPRISL
jgi:hypothetical protein